MRSKILGSLLFCSVLMLSAHLAEAGRARIPAQVSGLTGGEHLVQVIDLPRVPELQLPDGRFVDIGYKFNRGPGGEWVAHVGSDTAPPTAVPWTRPASSVVRPHSVLAP